MLILLFVCLFNPEKSTPIRITLPEPVFEVTSVAEDNDFFYILDIRSTAVAKVDKQGRLVASVKGRGKGPGEFNIPRSIAVSDSKVFVSDLGALHVFDKNLKFQYRREMLNNPRDMAWDKGKLFVSTSPYPAQKNSIYVYDGNGQSQGRFYEHRLDDDTMVMPYMDLDSEGNLFVLSRLRNEIRKLTPGGQEMELFPIKYAPMYKEYVPFVPFEKKHGASRATVYKWKNAWSEPVGIAVVDDQYVLVCFSDLEDDYRTVTYHLDAYELSTGKKVVNWKKVKGPLMKGGSRAWFFEEPEIGGGDDSAWLAGYQVGDLQ